MKKVNLIAILAMSISLTAIVTSCTNEFGLGSNASLTATAGDEAQAATISDGVVSEVDQYVTTALFMPAPMAVKSETAVTGGPEITVKPTNNTYPKTVVIDFGTTGITGKRGNVLKGVITVVLTDKLDIAGSSKTITFTNFSVNDNKIAGTKTVTNKGLNAANNLYMTISASETVTRADNSVVTWNSERTRERLALDKYSITGTSNGVNAKGVAYSVTIVTPLIAYINYPHFVQGSVSISTEKRTALIDYGAGSKDDQATVTINSVTRDFTLKR